MFGDGSMCKCNPIAEADLATYMINCIEEPDKWCPSPAPPLPLASLSLPLPLSLPLASLSLSLNRGTGRMVPRPPCHAPYRCVAALSLTPPHKKTPLLNRRNKIMDLGGPDSGYTMQQQGDLIFKTLGKEPKFWAAPIGLFDAIINGLAFFGQWFEGAEDAAELARIGKYYAVEDMLTTAPEEKFGTVTLAQHYERIAREGNEYDPYTTLFAKRPTAEAEVRETVEIN